MKLEKFFWLEVGVPTCRELADPAFRGRVAQFLRIDAGECLSAHWLDSFSSSDGLSVGEFQKLVKTFC